MCNLNYYKSADYIIKNDIVRKNGRIYDDNIYSFDIETTSIFLSAKNDIIDFDYSKKPEYYADFDKIGFMYIWQFSINSDVYYGRTVPELIEFLTALKKNIIATKIVYVHNLGFEFQFLRNFIDDFEVFARQPRHPIVARTKKFGIEFRCSLMLTNSKLENLPKMYNLPIEKMTGDLDYSKRRTSDTKLSVKELTYCEHDCLVVYELIKKFKLQYNHVMNIPLTQTGTLRRECQQMYRKNYKYKKWLNQQLPQTFENLKFILAAFSGGYTHANHYYTGSVLKNIKSMDITSSYPTVMVSEKYPVTQFFDSNIKNIDDFNSEYKYIVEITFINIYAVTDNTYLSLSKSHSGYHVITDNGRIQSAEQIEYILTDVDIDIIKKCYKWDSYTIKRAKIAKAGYLDTLFIKKILDLYNKKTTYKGIENMKNEYMQSKQYINSMYGMMVTNLITDQVLYNGDWNVHNLTADEAAEKLDKINNDYKTFVSQSWGVFVTAYARHNPWNLILQIDKDVVYCDTDSIKYRHNHDVEFEKYNKEIILKLQQALNFHNLDISLLDPADSKGKKHPLGVYDPDEFYKEFITLGAKKYCDKTQDDQIHITVSGVNKCGAAAVHDLKDFKKGLCFDYNTSGKKLLTYNDEQPDLTVTDYQDHKTKISQKYGINLAPTEYNLGISINYETYINDTLHYGGF